MSKTQSAPTVQLFPFLAVLVCMMGALILLLMATTRKLRQQMIARSVEAQAPLETPAPIVAAPAPFAAPPRVLTDEERESARFSRETALRRNAEQEALWRQRLAEMEAEREQRLGALSEKEQSLAAAQGHLRNVRTGKTDLRQQAAALEQEAKREAKARQNIEIERDKLAEDIAHAQKKIAALQRSHAQSSSQFAFVPYDGASGTTRRPIFIECSDKGLRILPEDQFFGPDDLIGFTERYNPLLLGTLALTQYWKGEASLQPDKIDPLSVPYVLLLVRPSGSVTYYLARRLLTHLGQPFGYELVEDEFPLYMPPPDPQAKVVLHTAVESAMRNRDEALANLENRHGRRDKIVELDAFDGSNLKGHDPIEERRGETLPQPLPAAQHTASSPEESTSGSGRGGTASKGGSSANNGFNRNGGSGERGTAGASGGTGGRGPLGRLASNRTGAIFGNGRSRSDATGTGGGQGSSGGGPEFGTPGDGEAATAEQGQGVRLEGAPRSRSGNQGGDGEQFADLGGRGEGDGDQDGGRGNLANPFSAGENSNPSGGDLSSGDGPRLTGSNADPATAGMAQPGGTEATGSEENTGSGRPGGTSASGSAGNKKNANGSNANPSKRGPKPPTRATSFPDEESAPHLSGKGNSDVASAQTTEGPQLEYNAKSPGGATSASAAKGRGAAGRSGNGPNASGSASSGSAGSSDSGGQPSAGGVSKVGTVSMGKGKAGKSDNREVLAKQRWGYSKGHATLGMERRIVVEVTPDKILVGSDELEVPVGQGETREQLVESVLGAIDHDSQGWGNPPENFYWIPSVQFRVYPGGNQHYERLHAALRKWGLFSKVEFVVGEEPAK